MVEAIAVRKELRTEDIDDVTVGCGAPSGRHGYDIARMTALAGYSLEASGVTVERFCGSGASAR